jgi:hypothetical protein
VEGARRTLIGLCPLGKTPPAPACAWALSTDSDTPLCSDQLNENIAAHTNAEAAIATFLVCFIGLLRYTRNNRLHRNINSGIFLAFRIRQP